MLGLLSSPSRFLGIWKEALQIVVIMMFIARPLAVLISTLPFKYTMKEKTFLMWGGIKGAVPIVLATYPMAAGLDGDGFIFNTIFFAVFLSCFIQGTTLAPLSKLFSFTERRKPESPHVVELHSIKSSDIDMYEFHLEESSGLLHKPLAKINFGKDVLISSIVRDGKLILPKGYITLHPDDILYVLASESQIDELTERINNPLA